MEKYYRNNFCGCAFIMNRYLLLEASLAWRNICVVWNGTKYLIKPMPIYNIFNEVNSCCGVQMLLTMSMHKETTLMVTQQNLKNQGVLAMANITNVARPMIT